MILSPPKPFYNQIINCMNPLNKSLLTLLFSVLCLPIFAQTLINYGSTWSYYDNQNEPAVQGSFDWNDSSYDSSSWSSGPGQLGYGDSDEATVINTSTLTAYFRHSFNVSDPSAYDSLTFNVLFDDGVIVYINGVEVLRQNMPGGAVSYSTFSSAVGTENGIASSTIANSLVTGTNVIAVEVHQASASSSDISFDFELTGNAPGVVNILRGPYLQEGTPTSVIIKWRTATPTETVVDYGTALGSLSQNFSDLTPKTEHTVKLSGLAANTVYYYQISNATAVLVPEATDVYFKTHPIIGTVQPYTFWALGDPGTANSNQMAVRDAYYNYIGNNVTDGMLFLGDNAYNSGYDNEYQAAFFDIYDQHLKRSIAWSTLGNHDGYQADSATQTGPYYDIFDFPTNAESGGVASGTEAYYSFDYGNIHFIVLESYETNRSVGGAMYNWAQNDIQNTTQQWIVAMWHHPPYTKGSHDSDTESNLIDMRQNFLPMLEANGVDLVLSGHSHSYERSYFLNGHIGTSGTFNSATMTVGSAGAGDGKVDGNGAYVKSTTAPEGAVYITAGSSGKISGGNLNHNAMYASLNLLGSCILEIDGSTLNLKFITNTGAIADYFTIQKGCTQGTSCDDGDPCTVNDTYDANCNCTGTPDTADADGDGVCDSGDLEPNSPCPGNVDSNGVSVDTDGDGVADCEDDEINSPCPNNVDSNGISLDSDGDGVCDDDDVCPGGDDNADLDGDGIPDFCDNSTCLPDITSFSSGSITHSGSGSSATVSAAIPVDGQDISFTISGLSQRTSGKPSNRYIEEVTITYVDGVGGNQSYGVFDAGSGSTVNVSISGLVQSVSVTLADAYDGNSSTTMNVTLGTVGYCVEVEVCNDADGDGVCDEVDQCPGQDDALIGTACDDGDDCTVNDVYDSNCGCSGTPSGDDDNDGVCNELDQCPGQDDALIGTSCDDGDTCTTNDTYDANCGCSGTLLPDTDGDGVCDAEDQCPGQDDALIGTTCDDGDPCTTNDTYDANCGCSGTPAADSDGDGVCDGQDQCPGQDDALIGTACDDGDDCTVNDTYDSSCGCTGTLVDSDGDGVCDSEDQCPGQDDALIGTACDDGDDCTINDIYDASCGCSGTDSGDSDSDGVCDALDQCPGQDDALIGTACNDGDDCTINDTYDANCGCAGTLTVDNDGDGICAALDPDDNDGCNPDANSPTCSNCTETSGSFSNNPLTHSGAGSSSTTLNFGATSDYASFTVSGLDSRTNGKQSNRFIDRVVVTYINGSGSNQTYGTFLGNSVSSVNVSITGGVQSVTVSLNDGYDGNAGVTMSVNLTQVTYCPEGGGAAKSSFNTKETTSFNTNTIRLYPNPASKSLNVDFLSTDFEASLSIYNVTGQLIHNRTLKGNFSKLQQVNLERYSEGLYLLRIIDKKGNILKNDKFVVKHE